MKKVTLLAGLLLLTGLGCAQSQSITPPAVNGQYLSFSMVTQEFLYSDQAIDAINRFIDIHEKYNVPADVIVDDASMQLYAAQAPSVIDRLKNSSVIAVSYHVRPPFPYYSNFDWAHLSNVSGDALYEKILAYETHGADAVTGEVQTGSGGYQFVKDQIGYAPIMVGMITEPQFGPTLSQIYKNMGAQFVIEHQAEPIPVGEIKAGLEVRPETIPLIFTEHLTDSPNTLLSDGFSNYQGTGPIFMSVKTHDNDFFATQSAWLSVYLHRTPPFDLSVHDSNTQLLSTDEQNQRWAVYEANVAYAANHQSEFTLYNAKTLNDVIQQAQQSTNTTSTVTSGDQPPIYVSIVSHNETPGGGRNYADFINDEAAWQTQHDAIATFAQRVTAAGAKYDWQSDWNFLLAESKFDHGSDVTNGQNLLEYLTDLGVEIDPHSHEQGGYNYADVAYLMKNLGVEPTHVVGGYVVAPAAQSKLEYFWQPLVSTLDPNYSWQAEVLWGGGSPNHTSDYNAAGMWRPQDNEHFLVHSQTAALPNIGPYTGTWEGIDDLLEKQAAGELIPGKMYTATVMVNQDEMNEQTIADTIDHITALADAVATGKVIWTTLQDDVAIWQNEYNSQPNIYQASSTTGSTGPLTSRPNTNTSNAPTNRPSLPGKKSTTTGSCGDNICQPIEQQSGLCASDCR